jgi:integrase
MEKKLDDKGRYKFSQVFLDRINYLVQRMYKRACNKGYISVNPFNDEDFSSPKSKQEQHEILALTTEEFDILMRVLKNNKLLYPIIEFMLNTGVRTQEALGLKWKHVDLENGVIYIRQALTIDVSYDDIGNKTGRKTVSGTTKRGVGNRDIYVNEDMINLLVTWKKEAPEISKTSFEDDDYVFGNSKSTHWTYSGFRSSVNGFLDRMIENTDGLRLHRIRHTVATMLAEDGASEYELMQLLGHTQTKTTKKYIDRASKKIAESNRNRLGRCLNERRI